MVGIDIGRAWVRGAIANLSGDIVARRDERTMVKSQRALITQIGQIAHGLAAEAHIRWRGIFATSGAPASSTRPRDGRARLRTSGMGAERSRRTVQEELGTKIAFENDVNLAALGEQWRGLGKNVANFAYLHVGTGVGAGLVLNGELFRGHAGAAGEVGYLPLATEIPQRGVATARRARRRGRRPRCRRRGPSARDERTALRERVFAAARRGDPVAQRVVELESGRIALAIAAIVPVIDPELVVLGGGIGSNGDLLLERVEAELAAISPFRPRIEVSVLGDEAGLHGAVATALQAAQTLLFARGAESGGRASRR